LDIWPYKDYRRKNGRSSLTFLEIRRDSLRHRKSRRGGKAVTTH
jgi:hypothetical protein